jgi:cholesterol oxidase
VITGALLVPDELDGGEGRGFYLEDAGFPDFAGWLIQGTQGPGAVWRMRQVAARIIVGLVRRRPEVELSAEVARLLSDTRVAAGSLPLLGMGRDIPDGTMELADDGKLQVDWVKAKSGTFFDRLGDFAKDVAGTMEAKFKRNPTWYLGRLITVHPLGGCPLGRTREEGVVDPTARSSATRASRSQTAPSCRARWGRTRPSRSPPWPIVSPTARPAKRRRTIAARTSMPQPG